MKRQVAQEGQIDARRAGEVIVDGVGVLIKLVRRDRSTAAPKFALIVMSNSDSPNGGTTKARSLTPLAI